MKLPWLKFSVLAVSLLAFAVLFSTAQAQQSAGRITIVSPQEPGSLLPYFDLLTLTHEVQRLVYDCLVTLDEAGDFLPQLAVEVPTVNNGGISADGTTYTFKLRQDAQWHDGQPVTSADVAFTVEVINDPDLPIPSRTVWEDIQTVETPDDQTVIITFPQANIGFLATAASDSCFILPRHLLEGTDIVNSPLHRQPVGSGPFIVQEWISGSAIELVKNANYREAGKPALDAISVRFIPATAGQRAALQRGDTDLQLDLTSADLRFVQDLPNYSVVPAPFIAWWQFWINNEDPILSDKAVREALVLGLDKSAITETVMGGVVSPLSAVLPPVHWAHNPDVRALAFDPERAGQLLDDAGWSLGSDGIREKDGQKLTLKIINIAGQAERRQVIQIAQSFWRDIGIDATIKEIDGASFPPTLGSGDFQLAYGWFGENQEPVFSLWLGTNWQRYANPDAFALLDRIATTIDREERRALIQRFQAIVAEDVPIIPLAPRTVLNAVHDRLQGYSPSLSGSLWNAKDWSLR